MKIQTFGIEPQLNIGYLLCDPPLECSKCDRATCQMDNGLFKLPFDVTIRIPGYGLLFVKKGFVSDGASIPRFFWRATYYPTHHRIIVAALAHDALYASEMLPRETADWIFLLILEAYGVPWLKRNEMYSAVRLRGGSVWKKHTIQSVEAARELVSFIPEQEGVPA
jgi:hypothetical protein